MAELTFNSPIRRDKWPRWMIKLHEYLKNKSNLSKIVYIMI